MLAACTGLAYHLSSAFRLEAYLGAFFPLPAVLSAARWSGAAAVKTTVSQPCVVLLSAVSQCCAGCHHALAAASGRTPARLHIPAAARCAVLRLKPCIAALLTAPERFQGSIGLAIGLIWRQRVPWVVAIPLVSLVRHE